MPLAVEAHQKEMVLGLTCERVFCYCKIPKTFSNDTFVHDQTDLGIHTVAYNKPEPPIASAPTTEGFKNVK
jgi:hypothetical protein